MVKAVEVWDKRWKPEMASLRKNERDRYERTKVHLLESPVFDGEKVYTTNGHLMAVFPSNRRMGKKYDKKALDVKAVDKPRKDVYRFAFNTVYLERLLGALGNNKKTTPGVIFEVDRTNNKAVIRVELTQGAGNKAYGFLMPMTNSGEAVQAKK